MRNRVSRFGWLVTFVGIVAVTGLHAQTASAQATAVQTASGEAPAVQQSTLTPAVLTPVPRVMWFSGVFRPADELPVAAGRERHRGGLSRSRRRRRPVAGDAARSAWMRTAATAC